MDNTLTITLPILGIIISSFVTYKIAKRSTSGSIMTSEAADLWAESNALRKDYKDRAERLEAQLEEVNVKLKTVTEELTKLRGNSDIMVKKIEELKSIIRKLRAENQRLLSLKKKDQEAI